MRSLKYILHVLAVMACLAVLGNVPATAGTLVKNDEKCMACHSTVRAEAIAGIAQRRHGVQADARTPSCTSCHGPSEGHIAAGDGSKKPDFSFNGPKKDDARALNGQCLNCHASGKRAHWQGSRHDSEGVTCSNCHSVHKAKDPVASKGTQADVCFACHKAQRAEIHKISRHPILEGKVGCSDCHNPHGGAGPKNLVKNTVSEVCWQCHAEKRGPFLFEHPPVVDDCMNCHTPHGSVNQPLLKAKQPWLCQDCHAESAPHPGNVYSGASLPGGRVSTINRTGPTNPLTGQPQTANAPPPQLAYRSCVNCHSQIHGSNHPAGRTFLR